MNQPFIYFPFLALLFVAACDKGVCIEGTVTDVKTGQPINGVQLRLNYYYFDHGSRIPKDETVFANDSGEFSYLSDKKHSEDIGVSEVIKAGYAGVFELERGKGDCEDVHIKMVPYNALLKLKIVNETGTYNSVYIDVSSKCTATYGDAEHNLVKPYPLELSPGQSHTQTFGGCIGDSSVIRWKFSKNDVWLAVASVMINNTDTTSFHIAY